MVLELSQDTFKKEVTESDKPVIVDFWAPWCGPCKMLTPVFEQVSGEFNGNLKFAKFSTEESTEIAQENHITGIPCMVIYNQGKEVNRIIGYVPAPELKNKIEEIISKI